MREAETKPNQNRGTFEAGVAGNRNVLYPGSAESRVWYALALYTSGRPQESLTMVKDAMRLQVLRAALPETGASLTTYE